MRYFQKRKNRRKESISFLCKANKGIERDLRSTYVEMHILGRKNGVGLGCSGARVRQGRPEVACDVRPVKFKYFNGLILYRLIRWW